MYSDGRPTVLAGLGGGTVVYGCPLVEASCTPVMFSETHLSWSS